MRKMIDQLFSNKYVNHRAVGGNVFLLMMYRFAYPFAVLLNKMHLNPNKITTLALAFSLAAFAALVFDEGWVLFTIFWGIAVLLDFCDGTVARMANKVSKSAFRYDHMSDLFKISLIFLGVGLRYDDLYVWVGSFSVSFFFLYGDILNNTLGCLAKHGPQDQTLSGGHALSRTRERYRIVAWVAKYDFLLKVYRNTYGALMTVNGHTLLVFFLFPFGSGFALCGIYYIIFIELWAIRKRIATLVVMPR